MVLEKLLKAVFINNAEERVHPPKTHDLLMLAEKSGISTTEELKDKLDMITTFHISARYPDYKKKFYQKCTKEFAQKHISDIEELRQWLKTLL